jgi:hypothetical protein
MKGDAHDAVESAKSWVSLVTESPKNGMEEHVDVKPTREGGDNRAFFDRSVKSQPSQIRLGPDQLLLTHTAVHEFGHAVENHVEGVQKAAQEFRDHRVGKDPTINFAQKYPGGGYAEHEKGAKDTFDLHFKGSSAYYCGKVDTEIVSMGLQALHGDGARFAKEDPEYAKFILGTLDGSLRK